jgi:hypothetical protein
MPRFINTRGRRSLALSHCDRCDRKLPIGMLRRDGDKPALKVCRPCYDKIDPWKLPPPKPDDYVIPGASPNNILLPEE